MPVDKRVTLAAVLLSRRFSATYCHLAHYVVEHAKAAAHFLYPDALVVAVLGAALFRRSGVGREPVSADAQRPVQLVLVVATGHVRHHRRASEIMRSHIFERCIQGSASGRGV